MVLTDLEHLFSFGYFFNCAYLLLRKLQANSSEALGVEVAVVDQYLMESAKKLKGLFPEWADITAYSSFMSSYKF